MNRLHVFLLASLLVAVALPISVEARLDDPAASGEPILQLGEIKVTGQKQIMEALQAIKVALKRPESSDPALRKVVVCRIEHELGSNRNEQLVCATNATLSSRREATQNGLLGSCETGKSDTSCSAAQALSMESPLTQAIGSSSDHVMRMPVNGAALKSLLAKIPDPSPEQTMQATTGPAPASAGTLAPAATTSGH